MLKIGYLCENEDLISRIHGLYAYNSAIQLYRLKSDDKSEIVELEIEILIFEFKPNEAQQLAHFVALKNELGIRGICLFTDISMDIVAAMLIHKIQYYAQIDVGTKNIFVLVLRILAENYPMTLSKDEEVMRLLNKYDCPMHMNGYYYVKTALLYYLEHPEETNKISDAYQHIAVKYNTTVSRVEKSMRSVFDYSAKSFHLDRISNSQCIYLLYQELLYNRKRGIAYDQLNLSTCSFL